MRRKWYPIVTGCLAVASLGISLALIRAMMDSGPDGLATEVEKMVIDYPAIRPAGAALFLVLVILHLIQCIVAVRESRLLVIRHLLYVLLCADAALQILTKDGNAKTWTTACFLYVLAAFTGSLLTMIRTRSKWRILLFAVMLILLFLCAGALLYVDAVKPSEQAVWTVFSISIIFFMVDIQGVGSIVPLAFSSIRMDILNRIIRKTYAVEILSGIVLLIVAFSFILPAFEPSVNNFGDALWYCFAIVTTIGFGDIAAISAIGRILSVILGIYGIIVVSLITSIIVNFYGEMKKEEGDDDDDGAAGEQESGDPGAGEKTEDEVKSGRKTADRKAGRKTADRKAGRRKTGNHPVREKTAGDPKAGEDRDNRQGILVEEIDL